MPMWYDWQEAPSVTISALSALCPPGEYRVIGPEDMPSGILSPGLLAKTHSILVVSSGTDNGRIYFMFNLNRVDNNDIDQMPYGIAFDGTGVLPSGVLIQHGSYHPCRTTSLPRDFYNYVAESGIYPLQEMPPKSAGPISDLKTGSQEDAFRLLVDQITVAFPEL